MKKAKCPFCNFEVEVSKLYLSFDALYPHVKEKHKEELAKLRSGRLI
jgi:hypothetical protein